MSEPRPESQVVVAKGTYLYDGFVECDLRIVLAPLRYGSADHEDPPEVADDAEAPTYYVEFGSTSQPGQFSARSAGVASLAEALAAANSAPGIGPTIRWSVIGGSTPSR